MKKVRRNSSLTESSTLQPEGQLYAIGLPDRKTLLYVQAELFTSRPNSYIRLVFKTKKARTDFLRQLRNGLSMAIVIKKLNSLGIKIGLIDTNRTTYGLWLQLTDSTAKINLCTI